MGRLLFILFCIPLYYDVTNAATPSPPSVAEVRSCRMETGDHAYARGRCTVLPRYKSSFCSFTQPGLRPKETTDCPLKDPRNPRKFTKNGTTCSLRHQAKIPDSGVCACADSTSVCMGKHLFRHNHPICANLTDFCTSKADPPRGNWPWMTLFLLLCFLLGM